MNDTRIERYCTPLESLEESLVEMQEMRKSKAPGKTWRQLREELKGQKDN
ncbi:hypothetical protein ACJDU8_02375 [Clostridium sp. WILCCON 0269]|uniref:Uncharacterized protein n=1 Tax=Candidatus Clostridium eludens TaxID=3381663 RepID=A0ABW8SEH0_9CLOT